MKKLDQTIVYKCCYQMLRIRLIDYEVLVKLMINDIFMINDIMMSTM